MHSIQEKRISTAVILSIFMAIEGCAVRTRLGEMIPGHNNSEKLDGEMITATFIPFQHPAKPKDGLAEPKMIPGASELAGALAKIAVDAVRKEFLREAEKYEHQYPSRLLLSTESLDKGGVILVTKWITDPDAKPSEGGKVLDPLDMSNLNPPIDTQIHEEVEENALSATLKNLLETPPPNAPNKMAASALALRVTPSGGFVYRLSGARLWIKSVGAKVVDFGWRNLPKFWQWPGALIFSTDSQMNFATTMNTKALIASKLDSNKKITEGQWSEILPESDVLGAVNIDLDKLPTITPIGSQLGSWLMVPTIDGKLGFVVMNFKFTERDLSNAKKYIEQGADALKNNENTISDFAKEAVGQ